MEFSEFEHIVKKCEGYKAYWEHILPGVPQEYRERFINTIEKGVHMPMAFDLILMTKKLSDDEFYKKLEEQTGTSQ